jgi:hypothetical protein
MVLIATVMQQRESSERQHPIRHRDRKAECGQQEGDQGIALRQPLAAAVPAPSAAASCVKRADSLIQVACDKAILVRLLDKISLLLSHMVWLLVVWSAPQIMPGVSPCQSRSPQSAGVGLRSWLQDEDAALPAAVKL